MTKTKYGEAYEKGFGLTTRFIASKGIESAEAQEISQVAWSRGWERRCQLRDHNALQSWVNSIALNVLRNRCRAARPVDQGEVDGAKGAASSVAEQIDAETVLAKCSPIDRAILLERYVEGYTTTEIGRRHSLKPTTVRVRLMRARVRLRGYLTPRRLSARRHRRRANCTGSSLFND